MKNNWQTKTLGEIGDIFSGNSINEKVKKTKYMGLKEGIPYIATKDVSYENEIDYDNGVKISKEEMSKFRVAHKNSVFICAEGGSAGRKLAFNTQDVCFVNKLFVFEAENFIQPRFIYYFYQSDDFQKQFKSRMTGLIGGVSMSKFKDIKVSFPDIDKQKQIVKILDEVFESISKSRENAEKNYKNAKELFESYLEEIFSNSKGDWEDKKLKEVCERITDGTHQTPTYYPEGIIFLSSRNVTSGQINWEKIKYIDKKQHVEMHKRVAPKINDILLAKNGTTGVAAMVDRDIIFDIYVSLALLRPLSIIHPQFLLYFINSPFAKKQFNKRLKGMGVPNLHLEEIREVKIHFPKSIQEQKSIVKKLDALSKEIKELETIYEQKVKDLEELKKSMLQKAFSGELTNK